MESKATYHPTENDRKLKQLSFWIGMVLILNMVLFSVLSTFVLILSETLYQLLIPEAAYIIGESLSGIAYFFSFAFPAWILSLTCRHREEYRSAMLGGKLPRNFSLLALGAIAMNTAASYVNYYTIYFVFPGMSDLLSTPTEEPMGVLELLMMLFTVAVVPAICEEILFRGAILSNLLPFGKSVAIFGSAIVFGLMHQNPMQFFYTALMGIILGYLYVRTRSLWVCMGIHFLNNAFSCVQSYFSSWSNTAGLITVYVLEILLVIGGFLALFFLWKSHKKEESPMEKGSFGVIYPPHGDFAEYPVTHGRRWRLFFSPAMIVYASLCVFSMVTIIFSFGILSFFSGFFTM